jgi:hypothetical protein
MRAARTQIPPMFEREDVRERLKKLPGGPTQPLTIHLRQEIDRLNIILKLAASTLQVRLCARVCVCVHGDRRCRRGPAAGVVASVCAQLRAPGIVHGCAA